MSYGFMAHWGMAAMNEDNEVLATVLAVASNERTSFVVFEHGTVVALVDSHPELDLETAARDLMKEHGPVQPGTSSGDFNVTVLPDGRGCIVTCHHPDIFTVMLPGEARGGMAEVTIGLQGRSKRHQDATELRVVAIADRRPT
jgi:hypothetical protein